MRIVIEDKEFVGDNIDKLAVQIAKNADFKVFEILGKAHNIYFSKSASDKDLSDDDLIRVIELANACYFKDCTECGEIRFYDSIMYLINNGHNLDELEEMNTWELISLCEDEANLRCN